MAVDHTVDANGVEALNVPLLTQPNTEKECLLYSLGMVLQYMEKVHPSEEIREHTEAYKPKELKDDKITIRDSGWSPTDDDLERLSDDLGVVSVEWRYWKGAPPVGAFTEIVEEHLSDDLPVIAVVDARRIQRIDADDSQHAIVITGMEKGEVAFNDPWGTKNKVLNRDVVKGAWDTMLNRLMLIDTSVQSVFNESLDAVEVTE